MCKMLSLLTVTHSTDGRCAGPEAPQIGDTGVWSYEDTGGNSAQAREAAKGFLE